MPPWLLPVIAVDLVITGAVLWFVFRGRAREPGARGVLGVDFKAVSAFTTAFHPRIGEYVRANWSGVPEHLPGVLRSLLDEMAREAQTRSLHLDRATLKLVLARSLAHHGIGNGTDVRQALEKVA